MNKNFDYLLSKGPTIILSNLNKMHNKAMKTLEDTLNLDLGKHCSHSAVAPNADFYEKEDMYVVDIDLPGIEIEEVELSCQADKLIVKGERKNPNASETESNVYINQNITYGNFEQVFSMPLEIDDTKVKATYKNGVLTVTLPKIKESKAKKIKIEAEPKKSHHAGQPGA